MRILPDRRLSREIITLAVPALAGLSTQMLVSVVDAAMVGRLDEVALAGMGVGFLAIWVITSFFSTFSTGTQTLVARRRGEDNYEACSQILNNSLIVALIIGSLLGYLGWQFSYEIAYPFSSTKEVAREAGSFLAWRFVGLPFFLVTVAYRGFFFGVSDTRIFMHASIIVNLVNIALNYFLIYGVGGFPRMGLAGSALATTIATALGVVIFFFGSLRKLYITRYRIFSHWRYNARIVKAMLRIALPVSFQYLFILMGFLLFIAIIGTIGTREQAASQAVITTILMGFLPTQAFGIAASVLVGQNLGTGDTRMAERYGFESARLGFYLMAAIGLVLFLIPDQVLYIITDKQAIIETARIPLRIVGASQAFYAIGIVLAAALQGAGATVFVMFADIVCNWLIFLPLSYLFAVVLGGGIVGAWLSLPFYLILYALLMVWRFRHGSWKRVKV